MEAKAQSHRGLVRKINEDAYLSKVEAGLFAVADGLGGHKAGEVASRLAVKIMDAALNPPPEDSEPRDLLRWAIEQANAEIFRRSRLFPDQQGMGTTLTAAWLRNFTLYIGHVGDSSAYHFRAGKLRKLTQDHSLVGEMARLGGISGEEARSHPQRHILTRALGTEPEVEVDLSVVSLRSGDHFLLCTDGLSSMVDMSEIEEVLRQSAGMGRTLKTLLQIVLDRGAPDNVTMVLIRYD